MRRRGAGDQGQATFLLLIPVLMGLVALTLLLMIGLGDGTRSRTQTRTAADAAALAAASVWRHALDAQYQDVVDQGPDWQTTLLQLLSPDALQTISAKATVQAEQAAGQFAERNDATVVSFGYVVVPGGVQYRVVTRSRNQAQVSDVFTQAGATASVRLTDGLCYVGDGTRLGLTVHGVCVDPWSASPPAVLPSTLPTTLPTPLDPAALRDVAYLVQ